MTTGDIIQEFLENCGECFLDEFDDEEEEEEEYDDATYYCNSSREALEEAERRMAAGEDYEYEDDSAYWAYVAQCQEKEARRMEEWEFVVGLEEEEEARRQEDNDRGYWEYVFRLEEEQVDHMGDVTHHASSRGVATHEHLLPAGRPLQR